MRNQRKTSTAWSAILVLLIGSSTSFSGRAEETTTPPTPAHVSLKAGDKAPFAGKLLTNEALAKIVTDYENTIAKLKAAIEKEQRERAAEKLAAERVCEARLSGEKGKLAAQQAERERERAIYENAIKSCKAESAPWFKSPYLHFVFGAAIGGGVCAAATRIK